MIIGCKIDDQADRRAWHKLALQGFDEIGILRPRKYRVSDTGDRAD